MKIGVIDYGLGNIRSVCNAIEFLGYDYLLIEKEQNLALADVLILPGVGAFEEGMNNLHKQGLVDGLTFQVIKKRKPILGICLGMQLFSELSFEKRETKGLGWVKGRVIDLKTITQQPVPHVGWNIVKETRSTIFDKNQPNSSYYFDHSFFFRCEEKNCISGFANYGAPFPASIQKENIFGVQFHPEKSQSNGLRMLRSFFDSVIST